MEGYDEVIASRLHDCLSSIYEVIRYRKEYQDVTYFSVEKEKRHPNLIENLGKILRIHPEFWNGSMYQDIHWIIEALHDFDHEHDGHHTEQILIKKENKNLWKKMEGFNNVDFWTFICPKCNGYETEERKILEDTTLLNCYNCHQTIKVRKN